MQAKAGKETGKDSFPARVQGAATRNASGTPPKSSGSKAPKA